MNRFLLSLFVLLTMLSVSSSYADLEVYSKTEDLNQNQLLKPRIYLVNNSAQPISNFKVRYYFTVQPGAQPTIVDYYSPSSDVNLQSIDDRNWYIEYDFNNYTLQVGATVPNNAGNSVGIHNLDWSEWSFFDDYSFENSSSFIRNQNIAVFDADGALLCGTTPFNQQNSDIVYQGLRVKVKNNAYWDQYWTKPSIIVENNSSNPLSDFTVWYYFTTEGNTAPILESWYIPDASASIVQLGGNNYAVVLNYSQFTLAQGARTPLNDGTNFGVHHQNWSVWNYQNDYSECNSTTIVESSKIVIKDVAGNTIYGEEPGSSFVILTQNGSPGDVPTASVQSTPTSVHFECTVPGLTVSTLFHNETSYQILHAGSYMNYGEEGNPSLPSFVYQVAVPDGATPRIEDNSVNPVTLNGYNVYPVQRFLPDGEPGTVGFEINSGIYNSNIPYPTNPVQIIGTTEMAGVTIAQIRISPVQFIPQTKALIAYSNISFNVMFDGGDGEATVDNENAGDIIDNTVANGEILTDGGEEDSDNSRGSILIITIDDFADAASELALWKKQLGYTVTVESRSSWDISSVQTFAHAASPDYLIILGDHQQVPAVFYPQSSNYNPHFSDLPYACTGGSDDYTPDMIYGRIPVSTADEAVQLIRKFTKFEKRPSMNPGFYSKAMISTYFEDDNNDGYEDRRYSLTSFQTSEYLSSFDYTVDKVFYTYSSITPRFWNKVDFSTGGALPDNLKKPSLAWDGDRYDIANSINSGCFLAMHRDHGYQDRWVLPEFKLEDIALLRNTDFPLILSIDCSTGRFSNDCFSERLLRKIDGGGIGVFAATAPSVSYDNEILVEGLINAMFPDPGMQISEPGLTTTHSNSSGVREIGSILMNGFAEIDGSNLPSARKRYAKELYHCFGDPSLKIYTQMPQLITAQHAFIFDAGTQTFSISSISCTEGFATLSRNGIVLCSESFSNGNVTLSIPESYNDAELTLTISSIDPIYKPLISYIIIGSITPTPPVAENAEYVITPGTSFNFYLSGTPEQSITNAEITLPPNYGTFVQNGLNITYNPAPGVFGSDRIRFRLLDAYNQVSNIADVIFKFPYPTVSNKFVFPTTTDEIGCDIVFTTDNELIVLKQGGGFIIVPGDYPTHTNLSSFSYHYLWANSIVEDSRSNLLIGGVTYGQDPAYMRYGLKVPKGQWGHPNWVTFPGCNENYYTGFGETRIIPLSDNTYVMVGTKTNGTFMHPNGRSTPNDDAYVTKLDDNFNILWETNLSLSDADDFAKGVAVTSEGEIVVTGNLFDASIYDWKGFIAKLDPLDGTVIWARSYDQIKDGHRTVVTAEGNIAVIAEDMILMMTDQNGDVLWVKDFWQNENVQYKSGFTLIKTSDNNLLVAGTNKFMKVGYDGNIIWAQTIDGTINGAAEAHNGFALTGQWSDNKLLIVKTTDIGQYKRYDTSDDFDYNLRGVYNINYYNSTFHFSLPTSAINQTYYLKIENNGTVINSTSGNQNHSGPVSLPITNRLPNLTEGEVKISLIVGGIVKDVFNGYITDRFNYNLLIPSEVNTSTSTVTYSMPSGTSSSTPVMLRLTYNDGTSIDIATVAQTGQNTCDLLSYIPINDGPFSLELFVNGVFKTKCTGFFMPPFNYELTVPNPMTSASHVISYKLPQVQAGQTVTLKFIFSPSSNTSTTGKNAAGLNQVNIASSSWNFMFSGRTGNVTVSLLVNSITKASVTTVL